MKVTTIIRQSEILKTGLIGMLILLIVTFAVTWVVYGDHPVDRKAIEAFADIIVPFGEYNKIFVVDGEREIFLVQEDLGDGLKLINSDRSTIADFSPMDQFVRQDGSLLVLMKEYDDPSQTWYERYSVVNYEILADGGVYEPQDYKSYTIDSLGRYYAGYRSDSEVLEVRSADGKLLCKRSSAESVKFFTADNLARFWHVGLAGTETEIINLSTGEMVETGSRDVIDGNGNLWICNANSLARSEERYVLDAEFNHFDTKIVGDSLEFSDDGKYLYGQLHVTSEGSSAIKAQNFVAVSEGNIIYKGAVSDYFSNGQVGDVRIVEIIGDILLLSERVQENEFTYDCILLDSNCEPLFENEPGHCFIDFDDNIALCSIINDVEKSGMVFSSYLFKRMQRTDEFRWTGWYDWYYMNKDGTVYDFNFEFGMPTRDGYAAVKSEKKWGVIRFR